VIPTLVVGRRFAQSLDEQSVAELSALDDLRRASSSALGTWKVDA